MALINTGLTDTALPALFLVAGLLWIRDLWVDPQKPTDNKGFNEC